MRIGNRLRRAAFALNQRDSRRGLHQHFPVIAAIPDGDGGLAAQRLHEAQFRFRLFFRRCDDKTHGEIFQLAARQTKSVRRDDVYLHITRNFGERFQRRESISRRLQVCRYSRIPDEEGSVSGNQGC